MFIIPNPKIMHNKRQKRHFLVIALENAFSYLFYFLLFFTLKNDLPEKNLLSLHIPNDSMSLIRWTYASRQHHFDLRCHFH